MRVRGVHCTLYVRMAEKKKITVERPSELVGVDSNKALAVVSSRSERVARRVRPELEVPGG